MDGSYRVAYGAGERSRQEIVLLTLTACGFFGVFPFCLIRFWRGEFAIAVFDLLISIGVLSMFTHVWRTRRVTAANHIVSAISISGAITTVALNGPAQAYWAYPAAILIYYLQPHRRALVLALILSVSVVVLVVWQVDVLRGIEIFATLAMTNIFAFIFAKTVGEHGEHLEYLAGTDVLTQTGNRRSLIERVDKVVAAQRRAPRVVSMIMLDIDHFKQVNDRFGHPAGDAVLVHTAQAVKRRLRASDTLYRYGGEEFVAVLVGTGGDGAMRLAEELRAMLAELDVLDDWTLTASFGVAEYREGENAESWLHRADRALYAAKE